MLSLLRMGVFISYMINIELINNNSVSYEDQDKILHFDIDIDGRT